MKTKIARIYQLFVLVLGICLFGLCFANTTQSGKGDKLFSNMNAYSHASVIADSHHSTGSVEQKKVTKYIRDQVQTVGYSAEAIDFNAAYSGIGTVYQEKEATNIVVEVNSLADGGLRSNKVVLFMASYDSNSYGAYDSASACGAMIETLRVIKLNDMKFRNKLVFLFADNNSQYYGGAKQFMQTELSYTLVKFIANYESLGTSGNLVITDTLNNSKALSKTLSSLKNVSGNSFVESYDTNTALSAFSSQSISGVTFSNIGSRFNNGTSADSVENLSLAYVGQIGASMLDVASTVGNIDLDTLTASKAPYYFSLFDTVLIPYSYIFVLVLGIIIIGLLIAAILINRDTKAHSLKNIGIFASAAVLGGGITIGIIFVISLILSAFGMFTVNALYSSTPYLFACVLIGAIVNLVIIHFAKKIFGFSSNERAFAGGGVIALGSAILGFCLPEFSFPFVIIGILCAVVCLLQAILNERIKAFNFMSLAIVLSLPLLLPFMVQISSLSGVLVYPYIAGISAVILSPILEMNFVISKKKINALMCSILIGVLSLGLIVTDGAISSGAVHANTKEQSIPLYYDNAVVFVDDNAESSSYVALHDKSFYRNVKGKIKFTGKDFYISMLELDYKKTATIRRDNVTASDTETAFDISVKKAFEDSFYVLNVPAINGMKIGEKGKVLMPYNGEEGMLDIVFSDNATISIVYPKASFVFNGSYKELTNKTTDIEENFAYLKLKLVKGITILQEIRQTI